MPVYNPDARGAFWGMTLAHGKGHFARAILEAVAFTLKDDLECIGAECNEIRITEEGRARVNKSRTIFEATDEALFAGFTPEEIDLFTTFLERLDDNLDAAGAPADPPPPPPPEDMPPHPIERK